MIWNHETVAAFWVLLAFRLWLSGKKTGLVIVWALVAMPIKVEWCRPRLVIDFEFLGALLEAVSVRVVGLNEGPVGMSTLEDYSLEIE